MPPFPRVAPRPLFRAPLAALALLWLAALLLLPQPARAQVDILPPVLESIALDEAQVVAGDTLTFRFEATDATGIATVHAVFQTPDGRMLWLSTGEGFAGRIDLVVPDTLADGQYTLMWVNLFDTVNPPNSVSYYRDGRIESESGGVPTNHALDFVAADFTISGNEGGDTEPPILQGVAVDAAALIAGDTLRFRLDATDASSIGATHAVYLTPDGRTLWLSTGDGGSGVIEMEIPDTLENGTYTLAWVSMNDMAWLSNSVVYNRDGRVESEAGGAPTAHEIDFAVADFTVSGNEGSDQLPPVLDAVSLEAAALVADDVLRLGFEARDASPVGTVHLVFLMPTGNRLWVSTGEGETGQAEFTIPRTLPDGNYSLDWINLWDTVNPPNSVVYSRDGRVESESPGAPTEHALDLSLLDFTVTGNELRVDNPAAPPDDETPVEIELTPVDEMEETAGRGVSFTGRAVYVSTSLGTLTAGGQTGNRVQAQAVGGGRYVAQLRSGQAGRAVLVAEIDDRVLPELSVTFAETRARQTLTFAAPADQTFAPGARIALVASASSGLPVELVSRTAQVCSVTGAEATLLRGGTCRIEARQPGNADFRPAATLSRSFTIARAAQSLTFERIPRQTLAPEPTLALNASASSGLAVAFATQTPEVCRVTGTTARLLTTGTCRISARQPGDTRYLAAERVSRAFEVVRATQRLTFAPIADQTLTPGATLTLTASASSGLAVRFASLTPDTCRVSETTATLRAVGTCRIEARQPGNARYLPAEPLSRAFAIAEPVAGPTGQPLAAGAFHSCALTAAGGVRCWGSNDAGQLGLGELGGLFSEPAEVELGAHRVVSLAAGHSHSCALVTDGRVLCWGANGFGQVGPGFREPNLPAPTWVHPLDRPAVAITAGSFHSCALLDDSSLRCWGHNNRGQLGDGTLIDRIRPVRVRGLPTGTQAIAAAGGTTCALSESGVTRCWGANDRGSLGIGSLTPDHSLRPLRISGPGGAQALAGGGQGFCTIDRGSQLRCWGEVDGALRATPAVLEGAGRGQRLAALGFAHLCHIRDPGRLLCRGSDSSGQLGTGGSGAGQVSGLNGASLQALAAGWHHSCALAANGRYHCWGNNSHGALGDASLTDRNTPVAVRGGTFGPVAPSP